MTNGPLILVLGVTASGKGSLAFELAQTFGGEIISIDSMKVYRRMDIGTAKPTPEKRRRIPYHLIDVVEPSEAFSVDRFLDLANEAIDGILDRGKSVIAVGGTALYIKTLLYGLFDGPGENPIIRERLRKQFLDEGGTVLHQRLRSVDAEAAARIHPNDQRRIVRALEVLELTGKPISSFQEQFGSGRMLRDWTILGLRREKSAESRRINMRVKRMIDQGLVEEVRSLLREEKPLSRQARAAIGYAEMIDHLQGRIPLDDAVEKIKVNTRKLAKAQRTWFKTFRQVQWLDIGDEESVESVLNRAMPILSADQSNS
ncbi:MAG: tRNA (adenosine(37)-N6)-dimethylallyltransferase MiaA [Phycisphaerae bacterium]|nr:tRNA (adenosine(37)-N6)-dimethylallyltransferase MiaA [Phycisphaerae bacterium]